MKKKTGELLFQIIPVMIGVYLGLLSSNWAEDRKLRSQTELLRKNLVAEIQTNQQKIESVIEYHEMLRDSTRHYARLAKIESEPAFFSGVRTSILTNNAFETGIQTGLINGLTFEEIQFLNQVYTLQRSYDDFAKLLLSGLITLDFDNNEQTMRKIYRFLSISMTDIVIKERQLLEKYEDILEQLKKDKK